MDSVYGSVFYRIERDGIAGCVILLNFLSGESEMVAVEICREAFSGGVF